VNGFLRKTKGVLQGPVAYLTKVLSHKSEEFIRLLKNINFLKGVK